MLLTLYKTEDGHNVINKVLTDPTDFNITLKGDTDIINPSLLMVRLTGLDYKDYNYAYIAELGRYYFINGIDAVNASLFRLDLQCDVLETYKEDILKSNAKYFRKLKTGDYLNVSLEVSAKETIDVYHSSGGFTGETSMVMSTIGSTGAI